MTSAELGSVIAQGIKLALVPLQKRITELEARPAAGVTYKGIYTEGAAYEAGNLVTKGGGLWLVLRDTDLSPAANPSAWKLVCKEGRA